MKYTHVSCSRCGTRVSNIVAANEDLVIRAFIECGACIEKQPDYETRIKEYEQEAVFLRERVIALESQHPPNDYRVNAGTSTCPCCHRFWVVTPADDCFLPACECYGQDITAANPARPCQKCGLAHTTICSKMNTQ